MMRALLFAALLSQAPALFAQTPPQPGAQTPAQPAGPAPKVRTAIIPDTIHVGDVITAAVRVMVPRGSTVSFPDSLVVTQDVENAGQRIVRADTTGEGVQYTAAYSIAAWRPGSYALPPVTYNVNGVAYSSAFDSVRIVSVLPQDTTGIKMKPLKSVLGGTRVWWPWILALVLLLLIGALAYWWWRRRNRVEKVVPLIPSRPAREVALERLDAAKAGGLVESGKLKEFYSEVADALRAYVADVDPSLSTDLTTSEVAARIRARGTDANAVELLTLLGAADLVKFARRQPRAAEAYDEWARVRKWVAEVTWPPVTATGSAQVAA